MRVTISSAPSRPLGGLAAGPRITAGPARRRWRGPKKTRRQRARDPSGSGLQERGNDIRTASHRIAVARRPYDHVARPPGLMIIPPIFFCVPKLLGRADLWSHVMCVQHAYVAFGGGRFSVCVLPGEQLGVFNCQSNGSDRFLDGSKLLDVG